MITKALIIVDVQNDFVEDGALAVTGGRAIADLITSFTQVVEDDTFIVTTQDWHPRETQHFRRWPAHCVAGTDGAELALNVRRDVAVYKGTSSRDDGYSGFDGFTAAGEPLKEVLRSVLVTDLVVCGLALDYCVKATALDAQKLGFKTIVPLFLTAPVDEETGEAAVRELKAAGVRVV